ncbi:hypothetical protein F4778DRAFT_793051 [Xylariomycetidae sp. FL2044]|nr:hypothetical protein F4778DRAFT_793051 [Xylariomycetidae sp. FL2044]
MVDFGGGAIGIGACPPPSLNRRHSLSLRSSNRRYAAHAAADEKRYYLGSNPSSQFAPHMWSYTEPEWPQDQVQRLDISRSITQYETTREGIRQTYLHKLGELERRFRTLSPLSGGYARQKDTLYAYYVNNVWREYERLCRAHVRRFGTSYRAWVKPTQEEGGGSSGSGVGGGIGGSASGSAAASSAGGGEGGGAAGGGGKGGGPEPGPRPGPRPRPGPGPGGSGTWSRRASYPATAADGNGNGDDGVSGYKRRGGWRDKGKGKEEEREKGPPFSLGTTAAAGASAGTAIEDEGSSINNSNINNNNNGKRRGSRDKGSKGKGKEKETVEV